MKQIFCFGDSNTYGLVPGTSERYGWNVRWTSISWLVSLILLAERVWQKGFDEEFCPESVETSKNLHKVYKRVADENRIYYLNVAEFANPSETDREHLDETGQGKLAATFIHLVEGAIEHGY